LKRSGIYPEAIRRQTQQVLEDALVDAKSSKPGSRPPMLKVRLNEYFLHFVVRDAATKAQKVEFRIRFAKLQLDVLNLGRLIYQGKELESVEWLDGDNHIEVTVEKAED
jgi:hypothetical protein